MSVGAKLFVMQLIVGLGQQIFNQLMQNFQTNTSDLLVAVGSAIVMLALTKIIPDMIQGLLNGVSVGNGGVLSGMVAGAAAGTAAGVASGSWRETAPTRSPARNRASAGLRGLPGNMARAAGNLASAAYEHGRRSLKRPRALWHLWGANGAQHGCRESRRRPPKEK